MRPLPSSAPQRRSGPAPLLLPLAFLATLAAPVSLTVLDPAGAVRWGRPVPCLGAAHNTARARPLLLREGPDGVGVYFADVAVPAGRAVLAVSPATGLAIGTGRALGGKLVLVRGLGDPSAPLPVEAEEGVAALLAGRGAIGLLRFRPGGLPVRAWATAGSAGGIPAGWPVLAGDPGPGPVALAPLAGPIGLVWDSP